MKSTLESLESQLTCDEQLQGQGQCKNTGAGPTYTLFITGHGTDDQPVFITERDS